MILSIGLPARADPPPIDDPKLEYDAARAAETARNWRGAIVHLERAVTQRPAARLRFHLARCHGELGELVEALREQERGIELLSHEPAPQGERVAAEVGRAKLDARTPMVTLRVVPPVDLPEVVVDGSSSATRLGGSIRLNPGTHDLRLRVPGYREWSSTVGLSEGQRIEQTVALVSDVTTPPEPFRITTAADQRAQAAPLETPPTNWSRVAVLGAEGVVALAGAIVLVESRLAFGAADDRAKDADASLSTADACARGTAPPSCGTLASALDDRQSAKARTAVGAALMIGGAAAAVTTWILWSDRTNSSRASVAPLPGGASVLLSGAF